MVLLDSILLMPSKYYQSIFSMISSVFHRGPNKSGVWKDFDNGIVLGHRRLSIVDLSNSGNQPMISYSGRYVIVFNGENL